MCVYVYIFTLKISLYSVSLMYHILFNQLSMMDTDAFLNISNYKKCFQIIFEQIPLYSYRSI